MSNAIVKLENATELVVMQGDLSKLSADQRMNYMQSLCHSLGLNPLTRPFEYLTFQGKMILYARADAAAQLRKIYGISITDIKKEVADGILTVTVYGKDKNGKTDVATGSLVVDKLKGIDLANATMKCETKAKRRLTLSICGLGLLDETETEDSREVTSAELPEPTQPFEDNPRTTKINEIGAKFAKLGVTEENILNKFNVDSMKDLTDEHLRALNIIGSDIVNKRTTKEQAFPIF